jgi:hypothetical protein
MADVSTTWIFLLLLLFRVPCGQLKFLPMQQCSAGTAILDSRNVSNAWENPKLRALLLLWGSLAPSVHMLLYSLGDREKCCEEYTLTCTGMYELGPAVKKLYQLRPKVYEWRASVASRVVNSKHDELRPAVSKELYHYRGIKCLESSLTQLSVQFLFRFSYFWM